MIQATRVRRFHGKVCLVTGGSRAIGRATVETLHRDGACVILHYGRSAPEAQAIADGLGEGVHLMQGDLRPIRPRGVWSEAAAVNGRIDVLVNYAGAWLASEIEPAEAWQDGWAANLSLNLQAPADLCRSAIVHFRDCGGGVIINVASRSSHRGDDADHLAYGAAKGGLLSLTKGIARGYARDNILAYAVAPGWVATEIAVQAQEASSAAAQLPLGEITPTQDVAEVIAFLASGRSRHATGATIDITGADYVR